MISRGKRLMPGKVRNRMYKSKESGISKDVSDISIALTSNVGASKTTLQPQTMKHKRLWEMLESSRKVSQSPENVTVEDLLLQKITSIEFPQEALKMKLN